jgi:uncharacterized caspase-like protein
VVAFGLLAEARAAEPRVALVIGNGAYRSVPSSTTAVTMRTTYPSNSSASGFAVIDGRDLDRSAMYAALGRFCPAGEGHRCGPGLLFRPWDADQRPELSGAGRLEAAGSTFTPFDLVKLDDVVEALNYTAGVKLLVLDACRDNPFREQPGG